MGTLFCGEWGAVLKINKEDLFLLAKSTLLALLLFFVIYGQYAYGETEPLTVTVQQSLTGSVDTQTFVNVTPGTYEFATSTIYVLTNNASGWNVQLYGSDQGLTDTVMDLDSDATVGITDQAEWIPGAATTSVGNAVVRASLDSSGQVLAFRVMSASGSAPFLATTWWGTTDADGTALWAGIASSVAANLKIGNAGTGSYSASAHFSTVNYYLDVPTTQQTGAYAGNLIYTITGN